MGDNDEQYAWLFTEAIEASQQPPTLFFSNDNPAGIGNSNAPLDWAHFALPESVDPEPRAINVLELAGQEAR